MSPKPTSPLLGYNNNVRHKGKVFHVQTEDSGVKYGHIITQLFMDGGRILKSVKTSYAEYIASERRGEIVREMMKQQHKAMFIALRDGRFDAVINGSAPDAPIASPSRATQPESMTIPSLRPAVDAAIQDAATAGADAAARYAPSELPLPPHLARPNGPVTPPTPTIKMVSPALHPAPPPVAPEPRPAPAARAAPPVSPPAREPTPPVPAASRYAITRPASIFGQSRPLRGRSVFGDDLVNDKSLDEVILSYLAAELENEKK
jgi:hypothetical protein